MSKVTVISGAAGALGADVAAHLLANGHAVLGVDRPESAARLTELAKPHAGRYVTAPFDVASPEAWRAALDRTARELGPPTGAVLIAGGWQGGSPFHEATDESWDAMFAMNLETVRRSLRALLPGMVERRAGSAVVIGSRAVERPWESAGAAAYAASKAAAVTLARTIAAEVLESGVRVNSILPSTLDTPANRRAMPSADPARWVSTGSIAAVVDFLLSDASRDVSGAALPVYGRA
jgi:NAD(P)-dependent dehydrogenase (short-subunit alcohol dehydrogenase family)